MEKDDLAKIVDYIIEKDLIVISDEIYSELTYFPLYKQSPIPFIN